MVKLGLAVRHYSLDQSFLRIIVDSGVACGSTLADHHSNGKEHVHRCSIAEPEPKLFWNLEPELKLILINIFCSQFGGC